MTKNFNNIEKMGECYICFNYTDEVSKCLCKNKFLHINCQKEYICKTKKIVCSVCNGEFTNINIKNNFYSKLFYCCYTKPTFDINNSNINVCKKTNKILISSVQEYSLCF